jgi:hypothetical protein
MNPIINEFGEIFYYNDNNLLHRINGPAFNDGKGTKWWYINGKPHRLDGPAIECDGIELWYIYGQYIPCKDNDEFLRIVKMKYLL